jgi:prevent-host-death family protein
MISVGLFEAKTNLSALIERVEAGEEIQITRHGKPVARLVSDVDSGIARRKLAAHELRELAKGSSLGGLTWQQLRDEGHK